MGISSRVGIFGTGNIGTDLLVKLSKIQECEIAFVIGRNNDSRGVRVARELGMNLYLGGLEDLRVALDAHSVDWVADTSSAEVHTKVREIVLPHPGIRILDFTPSRLSTPYVPAIQGLEDSERDLGLISCGAQSSLPLVHLIAQRWHLARVELVSSLASKSVGPATRLNLDEYIEKTEASLRHYGACQNVKTILIVNPAEPPINMTVSLYIQFGNKSPEAKLVDQLIGENFDYLTNFIPNFRLLAASENIGEDILITYEVTGNGDYLPPYAGNLDVLTATAAKLVTGGI